MKRRAFLSSAAIGIPALFTASTPSMAMPTFQPDHWDEEYDVVIIGGGAAGFAAACTVADEKLRVLLIEKQPLFGGSTVLSGGQWAVSGSKNQLEKNIKDSEEQFVKDMLDVGNHQNDPELVRAFVRESLPAFKWVTETLGVQPKALMAASGMSVPRAHTFVPSEIIKAMMEYAAAKGVQMRNRVRAERLLMDAASNRITGVKAVQGDKQIFLKAKKAVLLASGGFSRNKELLKKYSPLMANASVVAGKGVTGDGIRMALAYGADMLDTTFIKATYGFKEDPENNPGATTIYYSGAIMINPEGKRFVNESISYKLLGDRALAQTGGKSYLLFDEEIRKAQMAKRPGDKKLWAPYDEGKETDFSFRGNTVEEVAKKAGLDPKVVAETVRKYNEGVEKGEDPEYGRTTLTSTYGKPVKIQKAPFYIMPSTAALIATYCGLKINTKAQVIDVYGDVIKGLYAAGEITGGIHGAAYMTGTSVGKAISYGRIAARNILREP